MRGSLSVEDVSDAELLDRFVSRRDEAAFAALIARHGPIVLGICRGILRHTQDAEDAFQAAFLVLARKATSVAHRQALSSWLYRVAYRIALDARLRNDRRRAREKQVDELPHTPVLPAEVQDWRMGLHHELNRLPERYRAVLLACDVEERSRKEAARLLGWRKERYRVGWREALAAGQASDALWPVAVRRCPCYGVIARSAGGVVLVADLHHDLDRDRKRRRLRLGRGSRERSSRSDVSGQAEMDGWSRDRRDGPECNWIGLSGLRAIHAGSGSKGGENHEDKTACHRDRRVAEGSQDCNPNRELHRDGSHAGDCPKGCQGGRLPQGVGSILVGQGTAGLVRTMYGGNYEPSMPPPEVPPRAGQQAPPVAVAPAQTQAGGLKIEASAKGVRVELAEVQGSAQRVFYDEAQGRLQLEGSADSPATLFRKRPGQQGSLIRARKILYFIKDGKCQTSSIGSIDEL